MSKRAAIYARVSTDDQRGNYSIPTQIAGCLEHLQNKNYKLVGSQYVDSQTGRDCAKGSNAILAFVDDFTSRELSRPGINAILSSWNRTALMC